MLPSRKEARCPMFQRIGRCGCDPALDRSSFKKTAVYLMWLTDPTPSELVLAWTAFGWGLSFAFSSDLHIESPRYAAMLDFTGPMVWAVIFLGISITHLILAGASLNKRPVRWGRMVVALLGAIAWTVMGVVVAGVLPWTPFSASVIVQMALAWWVFLRVGDAYHRR